MPVIDNYKTLHDLENLAEPAFKEFKTTDYIIDFLESIGVNVDKRLDTGCFGTVEFGKDRTIAIRADIDALPVGDNYRHLCGHHLHTAALLVALKKIVEEDLKPSVNIRYIFQPAEEIISGARVIINEGGLDGVDEIYGLHVEPGLDLGTIGIKKGNLMAGSNHFEVHLKGESTHGAYPHLGKDVITAAADYINMVQKIVSRKIDPLKEKLISFGRIHGGTAGNILPGELELLGTFRYFDESVFRILCDELERVGRAIEEFYGISVDLNIHRGTPPVYNDESLCDRVMKIEKIKYTTNIEPSMGGEDFAVYLEKVKGVFFRLGVKTGNRVVPLHNIDFEVPDKALDYAVDFWINLVLNI